MKFPSPPMIPFHPYPLSTLSALCGILSCANHHYLEAKRELLLVPFDVRFEIEVFLVVPVCPFFVLFTVLFVVGFTRLPFLGEEELLAFLLGSSIFISTEGMS
mmetsp:Transcript_19276/g.26730  ORF Transcript_19276/g.26730 Transcript_19276/m.26730 type:complete len:103 (-) Transcript_19276:711-1019(-)